MSSSGYSQFSVFPVGRYKTTRIAYLKTLADEYGVSLNVVIGFADILGANEDFDGLVVSLDELMEMEEMS